MAIKLFRNFANSLACRLGYVPVEEMQKALADRDKIEEELLCKSQKLQSQVMLRDQLEKEVAFLRELELAHARNESGTQVAVDKLDNITRNLVAMMQSVWPEAYALEAVREEAKVA